MQNTWYIPWYISKKTVIYHIPTTGQNAMWYTMWYAMCDIPLYITPFFDIYHGIYHVIWRFGIYHSMVYTSWYKVYINMVYINLECYIPCYITLSLIVGWLSWHLWYITGPRVVPTTTQSSSSQPSEPSVPSTIQWESDDYRGRPKAWCYPFDLNGHRFRGKNPQVCNMICTDI